MGLRYRHTQVGWLSLAAAACAWIFLLLRLRDGTLAHNTFGRTGAWVGLGLVAVFTLAFSALTIRVDERSLIWVLGPRIIQKSVPLRDIADAQVVRNSLLAGWGIRWTPDGWLYNVSGTWAVRVVLNDGRRFRLGTDEPMLLLRAIADAAPLHT